MEWLRAPAIAWLVPVPVLVALAPLVWRTFRSTWRELDEEALRLRQARARSGAADRQALVALVLGVFVLALQEYFGKRGFYLQGPGALLAGWARGDPGRLAALARWNDLASQLWWGGTRVAGYLLPIAIWPLLFPGVRRRDLGLRLGGLRRHLWIYALCVAVMVPLLLLVHRQPDFGAYYPMYRGAGRSWLDFLAWEAIYVAQFFALEAFFRGWWLGATRDLGAASIFAMVAPYTMIHFGKPWLEVSGAIVAGVVLGSLAARTRSVWAGFLVHATVGVLMDVLALERRGELPVRLLPGGEARLEFGGWGLLLGLAWGAALAALLAEAVRRRRGSV